MRRWLFVIGLVACGPRAAAPAERGPAAADAAVAESPPSALSEAECRKAIDHVLSIGMTAERRAEFEGAERDAFLKEAIPDCQQSLTRKQLDCLLRARTTEDVDECGTI